mgnify:CR=1 FL=1
MGVTSGSPVPTAATAGREEGGSAHAVGAAGDPVIGSAGVRDSVVGSAGARGLLAGVIAAGGSVVKSAGDGVSKDGSTGGCSPVLWLLAALRSGCGS